MPVDERSPYLHMPLPHEANSLDQDLTRLRAAFNNLDSHAQSSDAARAALESELESKGRELAARGDALQETLESATAALVAHLAAENPHHLPLASRDAPGLAQVGAGLEVTLPAEVVEGAEPVTPGILSLGAHASENPEDYGKGNFQFFGHVKITDNFEEESAAKDGVAISPKGVKTAWDRIMGIKKETVITASGSWTVPETATYIITCVGGGGNGGWGGGSGYANVEAINSTVWARAGGGGGGGGAGQVLQKTVALTKGDVIPATIGGSGGGTTSFGSHLSAAGGGNGGNGHTPSSSNGWAGNGGAAGSSYGSVAGSGAAGGQGSASACCAYGGSGGHGGTSQDASYGNGGNGGTGQSRNGYTAFGSTNPTSGVQGCIRIRLA